MTPSQLRFARGSEGSSGVFLLFSGEPSAEGTNTVLPGQGNMSRRKQTTPNKVHCEYSVTQHCGILALAGLLWSETGRRGMMKRYSVGEWWLLMFHLRDCKKRN